jgi:hypothetical protein
VAVQVKPYLKTELEKTLAMLRTIAADDSLQQVVEAAAAACVTALRHD